MKQIFLASVAVVTIVSIAIANPTCAYAGEIQTAVGITSNSMGNYGYGYPSISTLLTQTGLNANYVSGVTNFSSFVNSGVVHQGGDSTSWLSSQGKLNGSVVFNLGSVYDLSEFVMWDGASGITASISSFSVYTSTNANMTGATFVGSFTGQDTNYAANTYDLLDTNAQYVELAINGNFGNSCCTVIGAIAFDVSSSTLQKVPEPASIALIGVGMIGTAVMARRRRQSRTTFSAF